jgi:hypothetical protein
MKINVRMRMASQTDRDTTTITLRRTTKNRLDEHGYEGMTYDGIVTKIMDENERYQDEKQELADELGYDL